MKFLGFIMGVVIVLASSASAADRETSAPLPLAPVMDAGRVLSPYVGLHLGWSDWRFERPDDRTSPTQRLDGYGAGAQIGVDALIAGGLVVGVVADLTIADLDSGTLHDGATITVDSQISAYGTMRGKIGYRLGELTPYLTGGAAWMTGETSEHCPAKAPGGHCKRTGQYDESDSFTRWGVAYGAGAGYAVSRDIEVFAEYLRLDFGHETHDLGTLSSDRKHAIEDIDTLKIGVNYRF